MKDANVDSLKGRRPVLITIFCILGLLGAVSSFFLVVAFGERTTPVILFIVVSSTVVSAISFVGLFRMKRWAIHLYTADFILVQIALSANHVPLNPVGIGIPLLLIVSGYAYYRRMT